LSAEETAFLELFLFPNRRMASEINLLQLLMRFPFSAYQILVPLRQAQYPHILQEQRSKIFRISKI